ncbi:MAG: Asp-tRNA(Asn)/Glu-tRNA(Gln) amidotransferase subunit GatB [Nitrospira sp.]|nr:Asp-tRNA(Asn)/Glu-tRNA(Gln) amidotransferase subunit GatB [bacterium]MBL7049189.1 Asp-tRNA(Asn)/Glu-tRNA(Gln) amidotransferase subunit GatB [Nitrospira sp.]
MKYEAVIGLEVHAQLLTETKIFCGCSTKFGSEPNTQTCPICIGMPGVLPVLNRKAVEYIVRTGLALGCDISSHSRFARKNYFYPDLPKGYQISQFELPLCENGYLDVSSDEGTRRINLTRIHLEEDAGKNIHEGSVNNSFVDLNRAGVSLMEIVSEPDIRRPHEAVEFVKKIREIVRYIGVCDGNMEQGSLRCDANVSVRPEGQSEYGVKAEIKNMNSFKFIESAVEYEIYRQIKTLKEGGKIIQETRLWNTERGITESMRSKEGSHDYRYFPDPDLMPVNLDSGWIDKLRNETGELPEVRRNRYAADYAMSEEDAFLLTADRHTSEWFEKAVLAGCDPKVTVNWIKGDLMRLLNEDGRQISDCPLNPVHLAGMLDLVKKGTISGKIAKTVFEEMYRTGNDAETVVREKGLVQMSDESGLETIIDEILANSPGEIERFRAGDQKLMGFFVGQVMKNTGGKANPKIVNELLRKKL